MRNVDVLGEMPCETVGEIWETHGNTCSNLKMWDVHGNAWETYRSFLTGKYGGFTAQHVDLTMKHMDFTKKYIMDTGLPRN